MIRTHNPAGDFFTSQEMADHEIEVLCNVLSALKIDDVVLEFDGDTLVAADSMGNKWQGKDFYKFLVEEAFVFEGDGGVIGIRNELLKDFARYSEHNGVPVRDNRVKELKAEN